MLGCEPMRRLLRFVEWNATSAQERRSAIAMKPGGYECMDMRCVGAVHHLHNVVSFSWRGVVDNRVKMAWLELPHDPSTFNSLITTVSRFGDFSFPLCSLSRTACK